MFRSFSGPFAKCFAITVVLTKRKKIELSVMRRSEVKEKIISSQHFSIEPVSGQQTQKKAFRPHQSHYKLGKKSCNSCAKASLNQTPDIKSC